MPKLAIKVAVDIILLLLSALPVLLFYTLGEPFIRGFACDDTSIRYPFKESTVTATALYLYGTLLPLISILVIEGIHAYRGRDSEKGSRRTVFLSSVYRYFGAFLFGCAMSQTIVDVCKYSVGRLRPHFLEVCNANILTECIDNPYEVVTRDPCQYDPALVTLQMQKESRLSFMSGHSSFSMFTMIYLVLYLQARLKLSRFPLVRPMLQQICFIIALFTGLSRVMDCKHHWSDVFAGFANGLIFAFIIGIWVAKMFKKTDRFSKENGVGENIHMHDNLGNVLQHA